MSAFERRAVFTIKKTGNSHNAARTIKTAYRVILEGLTWTVFIAMITPPSGIRIYFLHNHDIRNNRNRCKQRHDPCDSSTNPQVHASE